MSLPPRQPYPPVTSGPASVTLPPHRRSRSHQGHMNAFIPHTQASTLSGFSYTVSPNRAADDPANSYTDSGPIRRLSSPLGHHRYMSISPPGTAMSTPTSPYYLPPMPAPLNAECEHWLVTTKEAARQMEDLSILDKSLLNSIVTFEPASYSTVPGSGPGQNAWFKAQRCTCDTYKGGFQKVRRPATVREHLSKQPCAPPALARMAELQLRLLRSVPRRPSNASGSPSPQLQSSSDFSSLPGSLPIHAFQGSYNGNVGTYTSAHQPSYSSHYAPVPDMAYSWPPSSSSWPSIQGSLDMRLSGGMPMPQESQHPTYGLPKIGHSYSQSPFSGVTHYGGQSSGAANDLAVSESGSVHPHSEGQVYEYLNFDDI